METHVRIFGISQTTSPVQGSGQLRRQARAQIRRAIQSRPVYRAHGRQSRTAALADLKEATYPRGTQELTQQMHDDHEDPVDTVE